mmetsp:Transcript_9233/g.20611  ORF Transcript_9233/g.20611 Transcript_9233/m.20611 type:complete len:528 (-) Transcript_9233:40-1623(-)
MTSSAADALEAKLKALSQRRAQVASRASKQPSHTSPAIRHGVVTEAEAEERSQGNRISTVQHVPRPPCFVELLEGAVAARECRKPHIEAKLRELDDRLAVSAQQLWQEAATTMAEASAPARVTAAAAIAESEFSYDLSKSSTSCATAEATEPGMITEVAFKPLLQLGGVSGTYAHEAFVTGNGVLCPASLEEQHCCESRQSGSSLSSPFQAPASCTTDLEAHHQHLAQSEASSHEQEAPAAEEVASMQSSRALRHRQAVMHRYHTMLRSMLQTIAALKSQLYNADREGKGNGAESLLHSVKVAVQKIVQDLLPEAMNLEGMQRWTEAEFAHHAELLQRRVLLEEEAERLSSSNRNLRAQLHSGKKPAGISIDSIRQLHAAFLAVLHLAPQHEDKRTMSSQSKDGEQSACERLLPHAALPSSRLPEEGRTDDVGCAARQQKQPLCRRRSSSRNAASSLQVTQVQDRESTMKCGKQRQSMSHTPSAGGKRLNLRELAIDFNTLAAGAPRSVKEAREPAYASTSRRKMIP